MKYCPKCGTALQENMMFCPKCGTKYMSTISSDIYIKIEKLKKYQLALNPEDISWNYIKEDAKRAGEISAKQDKLAQEVIKLITEIFNEVTDENKDLVEREVYTYVLQSATHLCDASAALLGDWTGYQELFNQGDQLVKKGLLDPNQFLNGTHTCDIVYIQVSLLNGLQASQLKKILNPDVIANNLEYQEMTKKLVISFIDSMDKYVEREHKHFFCIGESAYEAQRKLYDIFIDGLPQKVIDSFDNKPWRAALDYMEENHDGGAFKRRMLDKEEKEDNARRSREQEIADEKYWNEHPEEYQLALSKKEEIKKISSVISPIEEEVNQLEEKKNEFLSEKENIENGIIEKEAYIKKLQKKIFGKKKAEEEISSLENQIRQLKKDNDENESHISNYKKKANDKNSNINTLKSQIRKLEQDIFNLRNK